MTKTTTAEAALESARKVIIQQQAALKPMSGAVYNDNGDMTISGCHPTSDECVDAYWAERSAHQWLRANPAKATERATQLQEALEGGGGGGKVIDNPVS
jgi:hypothetical protein